MTKINPFNGEALPELPRCPKCDEFMVNDNTGFLFGDWWVCCNPNCSECSEKFLNRE